MNSSQKTQSKGKRETLLSRSRRIIGKQLPSDSKSEDKNSDSSTPSATGDTSKRRAQILKAQRAHRRRTQNYIQELEKEVLRLRARENELLDELQKYTTGSRRHFELVPSPPDSAYYGSSERHSPTPDAVQIDLTEISRLHSESPCVVTPALQRQPQFELPTHGDDIAFLSAGIRDAGTCTGAVCGMDAQTAIDFILGLERPCLPHVKYDLTHEKLNAFKTTPFNLGPSHACTATATIIQSHQHIDFNTQKFRVSVAEIETLLNKSRSLPLGPEMTPVQVWAILVEISNIRFISTAVFMQLQKELHKYMVCNSFGTTIAIDTLRQVLNYFFPWFSTAQLKDREMIQATEYNQNMLSTCVGADWEEFF